MISIMSFLSFKEKTQNRSNSIDICFEYPGDYISYTSSGY